MPEPATPLVPASQEPPGDEGTAGEVWLSSSLTIPLRAVASLGLLGASVLIVRAVTSGPIEFIALSCVSFATCLWVGRPYLFLRRVRLRGATLIVGRKRSVSMGEAIDVGCTRLLRPHAVYVKFRSDPHRKIWFVPQLRWTRGGALHPAVHTRRALASDPRSRSSPTGAPFP